MPTSGGMRREQFEIDIHNASGAGSEPPTLRVTDRDPDGELRGRLRGADGDLRAADEIDVAYRFQSPIDADDAAGVLSVADRSTGAYVLEVATPAARIEGFVDAVERRAERTGEDRAYRLRIRAGERTLATYRKGLLLVYAKDGTLLRHRSLIPAGIEL